MARPRRLDLLHTSKTQTTGANVILVVLPVMMATVVMAVAASGLTGGFQFSAAAAAPKFAKLNPMAGFKRMFGSHAAVELVKALMKFLLVGAALWASVALRMKEIALIGEMALEPALALAGKVIVESAVAVSLALILIAMIDVPWQRWQYAKKLMMTREEVRQEHKEQEGNPEIKGRIRAQQREMARRRMMADVPKADVVVTNPTHLAVALRYDQEETPLPLVLAKGEGALASAMIKAARDAGVPVMQNIPLAHALYNEAEVSQYIPSDLVEPVAAVLRLVRQLANNVDNGTSVTSR